MVKMQDLNYDILEQITFYLEGKDMVNASLVCRAFWSVTASRMYRKVVYTASQAARYPQVSDYNSVRVL